MPSRDPQRRLAAFRRCTTAEEYFEILGIAYQPSVVEVNRLHILRHFGSQLAKLDSAAGEPDPATVLTRYREALLRSYQAFLTGTALDHRLFAGLERRTPQAFVDIDEITIERVADPTPDRCEVTP